MNLVHYGNNLRRTAGITDTPAGHGKGFAETVNRNGPVIHITDRCKRYMFMAVINKLRIDFVGDYQQIVTDDHFGDRFQIFLFHNGARRIVRIGQDQQFCFIRDSFFEDIGFQSEIVFLSGLNRHGNASGKNNSRSIGNIARIRNKHFIPFAYQGAQCQVDCFRSADGYENLIFRLIRDLITG